MTSCYWSQRTQTFTVRSRLRWPVVRAGVDFLFLFRISQIEYSPAYHFPITQVIYQFDEQCIIVFIMYFQKECITYSLFD